MQELMIWIAIAPLALVVVWGTTLAVTSRRSDAGILTSRWGRWLRIFSGAVRMTFRHMLRKLRRALTPKRRREALDRAFHERTAKAALETMGNMKGALMKLGQIVSFMDDTLPEAYKQQLKQLQRDAPPMDYDIVVRVIEAELGRSPEKLFSRFDRQPLASASIGQVHRARTRDGRDVAVKVQYPGVDRAIEGDVKNTAMLMGVVGALTPNIDVKPIVEELQARLLEELDYEHEAANQKLFVDLYGNHDKIIVPRVLPELSARRVLTSELVEGRGFYEFLADATPQQKKAAVAIIREFVFDSLMHHNVFNGDPHPGNYIFTKDGRIAFVDYGSVKRFDPQFIADFKHLNMCYLTGDRDGYFAKACEMRFIREGHAHKVDRDWLWEYARWFYIPLLEENQPFHFTKEYCAKALGQMFGPNMRKLNMPGDYLLINRITFGLNSILALLDACENWRELSMPYYMPDKVVAPAAAPAADAAPASSEEDVVHDLEQPGADEPAVGA
ncbi:MAG: AarF/ABC1/UbiB kinase family protein [Myxococcales bacterium]|nr:AarF/ABC1/UbiB kinase family protein [Myxococcales bacterium]